MIKKLGKTKLIVYFLAAIIIFQQPLIVSAVDVDKDIVKVKNQLNDIDEGIFNLDYNKYEVLASKGDKIESFIPREGVLNGNKFIIVERNKKSLHTTPIDISIIDSMIDRTYPGALQLADIDFVNNRPNLLSVKRKPLNISIDLPGMKNENTIEVDNPTYGNVKGSIDKLISNWSDNHSSTHTLPARVQYSESMVHSKSQIESALGLNQDIMNNSLAIDFNSITNNEKQTMIAKYKQIFYTVSAESPNSPSDLFDNSVTFRDLTRRGVSEERPPVMVSNVAYGRNIYVKLETSSKDKETQAAFKALLNGEDVSYNTKYKDILEQSTFSAVVLGGDSGKHNKIVTKDFDEIRDVIKNNAEFSLKNPAYPISYTSVFLKDNSIAGINNNTEYIETTSTEHSSGRINLKHSGAYVAQFNINWDEVSYDEEGNEVLEAKSWIDSGRDRTAPFNSTIYLPANAKNINVKAREATGLAWEWWRTVIDERNIPLSKEINITIGGTTLNPRGHIEYNN